MVATDQTAVVKDAISRKARNRRKGPPSSSADAQPAQTLAVSAEANTSLPQEETAQTQQPKAAAKKSRRNPIMTKSNAEARVDSLLKTLGLATDIDEEGKASDEKFIANDLPPSPYDSATVWLLSLSLLAFFGIFYYMLKTRVADTPFYSVPRFTANSLSPGVANTTWHPVLVQGLCTQMWKAPNVWKPENLKRAAANQTIKSYVQTSNVYTFADSSRPLARILKESKVPKSHLHSSYVEVRTNVSSFWINAENDSKFTYAKVDLRTIPSFASFITPSGCLRFNQQDLTQDLWLTAKPDTFSSIHYDMQHNYYTQIHGLKKFRLFPPWAFPHMYVFPETHPRVRQSQVPNITLEHNEFPNFNLTHLLPMEITLRAGQTLYIPPFWFHEVQALTPSVSVSSCSKSLAESILEEAEQTALPFESSWSDEQLAFATVEYSKMIIQGLELSEEYYNVPSVKEFIHNIQLRLDKSLGRNADHTALTTKICSSGAITPFADNDLVDLRQRWALRVSDVIGLFKQVQNIGVRRIILWTYIETLLNAVVGVDNLHAVATFCF